MKKIAPKTLKWLAKPPVDYTPIQTSMMPLPIYSGLNNGTPAVQLTEGQLSSVVNLTPSELPSLRTINSDIEIGYTGTVQDVRSIFVIDPATHILVLAGTTLYKWNGTAFSTIATGFGSSSYVQLAPMSGKYYLVDGATEVREYNPSTSTLGSVISGSPDNCDFIVAHRNRLFAAEGKNLNISNILLPDDWTTVDMTDIIVIEGTYGEDISGLAVIADHLVIAKERSISELWGFTPGADGDMEVIEISTSYGCMSPMSLQVIDGTMYCLSHMGIVSYGGGVAPYIISDPAVQEYINTLNLTVKDKFTSCTDGRFYYLSVATGSSTTNNAVIVYDTRTKTFWSQDITYTAMANHKDRIFVGKADGKLYEKDYTALHGSLAWSFEKPVKIQDFMNRVTLQRVELIYEVLHADAELVVSIRPDISSGDYTILKTITDQTTDTAIARIPADFSKVYDKEWGMLKVSGTGSCIVHAVNLTMRAR